jgi:uncharacterized membrane protein
MVKKRKSKRHAKRTETENWEECFGKHMERHGKEWKCFWCDTLGFVGPLFRSIIGIVFLAFGIWLLNLINLYLSSVFIFLLSTFLLTNIHWLFLASLFFGYCNYFSRRYPRTYWLFSPIVIGLRVVFILWVLTSIFMIVSVYNNVNILEAFSRFFYENLWTAFILIVFIGYVFEFIKKIFCKCCKR